MLMLNHMKAIYVGGIGINYKRRVTSFKLLNPSGVDLGPADFKI